MHRLLIRQLRHDFGIEDAGHWLALNQAIRDLAVQLEHDRPMLAQALARMPALLERISSTYGQHERHLSLLRSSLETSSRELSEVQEALRAEISARVCPLESPHCPIPRLPAAIAQA
jgi:hypothetical protein